MTYPTSETSVQAAQPAELYQFRVGGDPRLPAPTLPAGSGTIVAQETWAYVDTGTAMVTWVPTNVNGLVNGTPSGGTAGTFTMGSLAYGGGAAGGPSAVYHSRTFSGLTPNTQYRISTTITRSVGTGFTFSGMRVRKADGGFAEAGGGGATPSSPLVLYVTSSSTGTLLVQFGWFLVLLGMGPVTLTFGPIVLESVTTPVPEGFGGTSQTYNYTSADVALTFLGDTYASDILIRTALVAGGSESGSQNLEITIPRDHALATLCAGPPRLPVSLTVYRLHRGDLTGVVGTYVTPWRGQVVGLRMQGAEAVLVCAPVQALLERKVPRYLTQKTCGHMLYDGNCQAVRASFTSAALTVATIVGRVVTVTGAATAAGSDATKWQDGMLIAPDGTIGSIEGFSTANSNPNDLTLKQALPGLLVGDSVTLVAGCDKRVGTCKARFNNVVHFGGEPVMPIRNPGTGAGLEVSSGSGT